MTPFETALAFVARWEGGWSDHARDPGGATQFGITRKTLAWWRGRAVSKDEVRALSIEEAHQIYRAWYWDKCRCGDLPPAFALLVFDCAVNQGVGRARKVLERAVGAKADGEIGPRTMQRLEQAWQSDPRGLIREYCARRNTWYGRLSSFVTFGLGWSRRLFDAQQHALELLP